MCDSEVIEINCGIRDFLTFTWKYYSLSLFSDSPNYKCRERGLIVEVGWWNLSKSLTGVFFGSSSSKVEPRKAKWMVKFVQKGNLTPTTIRQGGVLQDWITFSIDVSSQKLRSNHHLFTSMTNWYHEQHEK